MSFAGSVIKWVVLNIFYIIIWVFGSYLLGAIFNISSGLIASTDPQFLAWKSWLVYIWNYSPVIVAVGSALWIIARSQEKDIATYVYD